MNILKRITLKISAFFFMMFFSIYMGFAQPTGPEEPPLVPIDGGIGILIAAGALFGTKKLYDMTRNKEK